VGVRGIMKMTTDLTNGTKKIDLGNMHWYDDITHNWELLDRLIGIVQSLNIDNIPTKTSDLTNDLGFVTEDSLTDVNNGTLNLQKNGATIGTFKANQPTDVTVNFKVPTKTSELTNDKHFITLEELPNSNVGEGTLTIKKNNAVQGTFTPTQDENVTINLTVPLKVSELINDTGFITNAAIPSKTSQLTNDSGFITNAAIPSKTSQLENDSGFAIDDNIVHKNNNETINGDKTFNDKVICNNLYINGYKCTIE
jgi:hypothetical protein